MSAEPFLTKLSQAEVRERLFRVLGSGWMNRKALAALSGVNERSIRRFAQTTGLLLSNHEQGFRRTDMATREEMVRSCAELYSRAFATEQRARLTEAAWKNARLGEPL